MQPIIRSAVVSDIPKMYAISTRAHQRSYAQLIPASGRAKFDKHYTPSEASKRYYIAKMALKLGNPAWRIWVAELDGSVVGFTLEQIMGDALVQKRGLFVDPDMQGRGIGKLLFEESLKDIPRGATVRLSVIENNHRAKELYKKYGFVTVGYDSKSFYGSRLEVMELQLD